MDRERVALPLTVQADLLSLSRSSLYYRPRAPSAEEVALRHRIDALYTQYPFYGSRRIAAQLRREGLASNRKAVQRHMQEMGIAGIAPGPNLSRRNSEHRVYPYLPRDVTSAYPNHIWGIDSTSVRLPTACVYLACILDACPRRCAGWHLSRPLDTRLTLAALEQAIRLRRPSAGLIHQSGRGVQDASADYVARLVQMGARISMSAQGKPNDNAKAERCFKTLQREEGHCQLTGALGSQSGTRAAEVQEAALLRPAPGCR